jgi:hypothetical protein
MIFQNQGLLSLLEAYRLENFSDNSFGFPLPETIEPIVWSDASGKKMMFGVAALIFRATTNAVEFITAYSRKPCT